MRTSTATLAELGMSIVALRHADRWKSRKTVEGFKKHNIPYNIDRVSRLHGVDNTDHPSTKIPRLDENTTANANSNASSDFLLSVVHENYTYVIFEGFMCANVSFLNNVISQTEPVEDVMRK